MKDKNSVWEISTILVKQILFEWLDLKTFEAKISVLFDRFKKVETSFESLDSEREFQNKVEKGNTYACVAKYQTIRNTQ